MFFMSKIGAELVHLVHHSSLWNQTMIVNPSQIKPSAIGHHRAQSPALATLGQCKHCLSLVGLTASLIPLLPLPSYPSASWWGIHPKQQRIFS